MTRHSFNGHLPGIARKPVPECLRSRIYWS